MAPTTLRHRGGIRVIVRRRDVKLGCGKVIGSFLVRFEVVTAPAPEIDCSPRFPFHQLFAVGLAATEPAALSGNPVNVLVLRFGFSERASGSTRMQSRPAWGIVSP